MAQELVPGGGAPAAGRDESSSSRMGIIEVNDLVYKLESDLSVAINRTHKNGFFQTHQYTNNQTSIAIFNSGADYIDARRSWLTLNIAIPQTTGMPTSSSDALFNAFISCYFGPTGSVLNFIDSIVVYTRSGDELSRVMDYGQLMYSYIPMMFGKDWARTVGQMIGLGSYLGGYNNNRNDSTGTGLSSNHRKTFNIPLYLLSPVFTYGRLLPSMMMSGLKVEIKWKTLEIATQQFWENAALNKPLDNLSNWFSNIGAFITEEKRYLAGSPGISPGIIGSGGLDPTITAGTQYQWTSPIPTAFPVSVNQFIFGIEAGHWPWDGSGGPFPGAFPNETVAGNFASRPPFIPGIDVIGFVDSTGFLAEFEVVQILSPTTLKCTSTYPTFALQALPLPGLYRRTKVPKTNVMQRTFGGAVNGGQEFTPTTHLSGYTINEPQFTLCSIQLTDSVQRHLNEYSATNGLEIVYADWDRTSQPLNGTNVQVYTENRKSASRALMAFSVVVDAAALPSETNSFASIPGGNWTDYQWQLGSLYFPQQVVGSKVTAVTSETEDDMFGFTFAFTLDAWDRLHPKAPPTMMGLSTTPVGRDLFAWNNYPIYTIPVNRETVVDPVLVAPSDFGKYGSHANGAQMVATTLERSSMFDLSGIPINNSRVLAVRGHFNMSLATSGTQFLFLKYVKLARFFLINAEVES